MSLNTYQLARMNKDRNFDGQFYFAVKTTGIFCRPSCPSPKANEENVVYYKTLLEALDHGFRPCLRCRPDIHTDYYATSLEGAQLVSTGLNMIYQGYLNDHSVKDLAQALYSSERYLRQLFVAHMGLSPIKVANFHKSLFAKKLLLSTSMKITDIAYASGYQSIRQFNDGFKKVFKMTPSALRKQVTIESTDGVLIPYAPDFDFDRLLNFMAARALKGIEVFGPDCYTRSFRRGDQSGYFTVRNQPEKQALALSIHTEDVRAYMPIYHQVRRMFDLETDFVPINNHLKQFPLLGEGMTAHGVPPLPVAYNPFEFLIRAILGQVVSVSFATSLAQRLVEGSGLKTPDYYPEGLDYYFPTPEELSQVDLTGMGMTKAKIATIGHVIQALRNKALSLDRHQSFHDFHKDFIQLKGIGEWTVNYVAMRGLGMKDAFPFSDLAIIKAFSTETHKATHAEIKKVAEGWRPYRAYATMCLWHRSKTSD